MTKLCFIDTETTSLRPDRRAWEIGIIVREPGREDAEHQWFIRAEDLDLGNSDLMSLNIGRFYERHPQMRGLAGTVPGEAEVLAEVEKLTRGAHMVGAVPNFDADVLGTRMRAGGICPSWHYHLVDVEALAAGYIACLGKRLRIKLVGVEVSGRPPWKSDDLSAAIGVTVSDEDRHTALGDAKWARAIYDTVMGETP